jgi:CheY-like chemotaxis protein
VLTSLAQRTTRLEATASGADLFLNKPFTEAQLLTALRQFLPEPG